MPPSPHRSTAGSPDPISSDPAWSTAVPSEAGSSLPWCSFAVADAIDRLGTDSESGLDVEEVARRSAVVGPNRLTEPPRRPAWKRFTDQFRSGIVYILLGAAVLAGLVGDIKDSVVIAVVLLVNAILGYLQEAKAEDAMAALKQMLVTRVRVRRSGHVDECPIEDVVPGDIVLIESGDLVPADGRLIRTIGLSVDESALTGESLPVDKRADDLVAVQVDLDPPALGDQTNVAFMNTTVARGRAELAVTATGMSTEMGKVAELLIEADPGPTPLQRQLDILAKSLAVIAGAAATVVFALGLAHGQSFSDAVLGAVVLAVAAIPEGLPAVVTVTLAVGVSQMAKRNAIVKRLPSVETLGSTSVICSDKTGTLTLNEMTARALVVGHDRVTISGDGYDLVGEFMWEPGDAGDTGSDRDLPDLARALLPGVLCSDASVRVDESGEASLVGDPTEGAVLVAGRKAGLDPEAERVRLPRVAEVPFDSATKFMATFHRDSHDRVVLFAKGAPEVLFDRCNDFVSTGGEVVALDGAARERLGDENVRLASRGLRVLALASRRLPGDVDLYERSESGTSTAASLVEEMTLEALLGIVDPPRAEAAAAIELCHQAGIDVKMITGDHAATAGNIAAELGIEGRVLTGDEITDLSDAELEAEITGVGVCARVSPQHKVRVVEALRANDRVVAMTGDGVNDAAALKTADIGVAMGITGTEVTKEAGDMVLADDNFASIVGAVERGRTIYDNIVKFVRFQVATSIGAIGTIVGAGLLGMPTPFTPIQVLWVNLIADGPPALSLGVDPPEPDIMEQAPRHIDEPILNVGRILLLCFFAVVMTVGTLGLFAATESRWGTPVALTMAFSTFVYFQMFDVFNARSEHRSIFGRYTFTNGKLWAAVGAIVVLQVLAVRWGPLQQLFGTTALTGAQIGICLAVASTVLWAEEIRKLGARHLRGRGFSPRRGVAGPR